MAADGRGGSIVSVSAATGLASSPFHAIYGAAKAALIALARTEAVEWGPLGIRVNTVAPGGVETRPPADPEEMARSERAAVPLGRRAVPDDIAGATIAVSNTGSYGSEAGTPILSPGTSVTLAIGVIRERALVIDGQVVARPAATLSLTFDHRVLDGAAAGRALTQLVDLLQSDERLRDLPR